MTMTTGAGAAGRRASMYNHPRSLKNHFWKSETERGFTEARAVFSVVLSNQFRGRPRASDSDANQGVKFNVEIPG